MRKFVSVMTCCMTVGTGALAQDSGVFIANQYGEEIQLSPESVYRALGDRRVMGRDVIGNNALNWNQIDGALPGDRIKLSITGGEDAAVLRDAIRAGCYKESGDSRACNKVGVRLDRLIQGGGFSSLGTARFDRQSMTLSPPPVPAPLPPAAPAPPMGTNVIETQPIAAPAIIRPAPTNSMSGSNTMANTKAMETATSFIVEPSPVVMPAETAPVAVEIKAPQARERVYASRLFLGRDSFPPEAFAAYGILAFQTLSTSDDAAKYLAICEAFFSALINSGDVGVDVSKQMVTVWPIDDRKNASLTNELNTTRVEDGSCEKAINYYDIHVARDAIDDAKDAGIEMTGRGPFLLAWAPAGSKGDEDAIVLAADLSDVKTVADAKDVLRIWRDDIEGDPTLWDSGFSAEKLRVKLRQIANRYGEGLLKFLGG